MKKEQKDKLLEYLSMDDIEIYSLGYLEGGNVSADTLSIYFYKYEGDTRFIFSTEIKPNGRETVTKRVKVF